MIIKIQHPVQKNKTLLILDDFKKETKSFESVHTRNKLNELEEGYVLGNHYMAIVHDTEETREDYQFDLNSNDEELECELSATYAPSLDALIRCFLDTGEIDANDVYKIWVA